MARILENISDLATDSHDYEGAQNALVAGLKLTATPAAASWRPMLLGTRAKLALAEGRLADAQSDLGTAFAIARDVTTDQSYSSLHLTAYRVYKAANDPRRALEHLEIYRQIDQQGRNLAASTNAALMTARFDFANQNARIATLKAGQLSRDVALTRLRARQSTIFFSGLLTLLSTLLAFLFVYLRSIRRSRNDIMRANEQLARTNTELGEALQVKSQFLATTSHEIRTPLNGILGMTQVILADRAIGGVTRDRISLVDAAGRAMRTLVDDILDFAKMDSGTVRLDTTVTDLRTMIPNLVSLWKGQAEEKGIDLRLSLRDVEEPLVTDAARLRQVIFNLLSNAIKFTAEGAVTVDVRAEDEGQSRKIMIAVTDSGIGIAAEAHHSIFEPFRQLDTSTTRQFGGTGLGLAISRHLARVLGGDITVTSTPGHGATFTIRLPYPAFVAEQQSVTARTMVSILIVSDNSIRRSFLRTALEAEFGFTAACDATELVSFVNDNVVERVLVDIGDDQGKDAVDNILAAWIRRPSQPRLVLLLPAILTNYLSTWQTAGVSRVIVKPCRVDALIKMLRIDGGDESESPDAARDPVAIAPDVP